MRHGATIARLAGLLAAIACCTYIVIRLTKSFTPQTHSWLFGGGAFLFGITEMFFPRLLTELSNVLRYPGFSIWQHSRLRQVIMPFKKTAWRLWVFSQALRATSAICAVILAQPAQNQPAAPRPFLLWTGYSTLFFAMGLSLWTWRHFIKIDEFRDKVAFEEAEAKEKKRLSTQLEEGKEHDFASDENLKGFNKPPEAI